MLTGIQVIDNSGALLVECVNVLKNKVNNGWGSVGDEIVVVVQKARPISAATQASVNAVKVRRGDVRRAVIVRTRKAVRRPDGSFVRFDDNAAVLLNNKREMLGTRIGGMVSADLRLKGWGKIVSLAPRVRVSRFHCFLPLIFGCRSYSFNILIFLIF
jgi:ribosomal protein L14